MSVAHNQVAVASEWARLREARREADRRRVDGEVSVAATPETLRKLRRDVVETWHTQGRLGDEQLRAAGEIQRVWHAITAGLWPRSQPLVRAARGADVNDWPASLRRAYTERYVPWRTEAGLTMASPRLPVLALVLDVVVDNLGPKQMERRHAIHRDRAVRLVQAALHRYAEMAGWLDGPFVDAATAAAVDRCREKMAAEIGP